MPRGGKREGAGKPIQYDEALDKTIKFRLSETEKTMIINKADSNDLSVGRYLVKLVKEDK